MAKKILISGVASGWWHQSETAGNTAGVGINYKYGFAGSIKDYSISCLWPDATNGKELAAEGINIIGEQIVQAVIIFFTEP